MKELSLTEYQTVKIEFSKLENQPIEICGMIQNLRILAWGGFILLRTPLYLIQAVANQADINFALEKLTAEAYIKVKGIVKAAKIKDNAVNPRDYEIQISEIELISQPSENLPVDISKKELNLELNTKFDLRPLTLRHPKQRAIFKIAAVIYNEFGTYLTNEGFTRICSPKIVYSGAEGGANIFQLGYFDKTAYLAQSPQFYKQMMVGVFGRVFEEAPVFRAEKHATSRHLNEYISLDIEMALNTGFEEIMITEANMLRSVFDKIASECAYEVELLGITLPVLDKIVTLKFSEVHEIVYQNFGKDFRTENDLAPEEEQLICGYVKEKFNTDFVFVTHYPTSKRPFYAMSDPANPEETLSFDLLFRGLEITTGGQRLHKYEDYVTKMTALGMNIECFASYLQTFKYGMPPHGGFGLGLERLTALICGLPNVKEASLFPRDINRLEP